MNAQVITEIERRQKRGERPRFVQHGRGCDCLSKWMGRCLALQIEQSPSSESPTRLLADPET